MQLISKVSGRCCYIVGDGRWLLQVEAIETKYGTNLNVDSTEDVKAIYGTFVEAVIPLGAAVYMSAQSSAQLSQTWVLVVAGDRNLLFSGPAGQFWARCCHAVQPADS